MNTTPPSSVVKNNPSKKNRSRGQAEDECFLRNVGLIVTDFITSNPSQLVV
jgi:hypothetical protein